MLTPPMESLLDLARAAENFSVRCIDGLEVDEVRCTMMIEQSLAMCTALAPEIGYDAAAKIAKTAHKNGTTLKEEAVKTGLVTAAEFDAIVRPEDMLGPK